MKKVFFALCALFVVAICTTTPKADTATAKAKTENHLLIAKTGDACCTPTCHSPAIVLPPTISTDATAMVKLPAVKETNAKVWAKNNSVDIGGNISMVCAGNKPDVSIAMVAKNKKDNSTNANIDTGPVTTATFTAAATFDQTTVTTGTAYYDTGQVNATTANAATKNAATIANKDGSNLPVCSFSGFNCS